jgi:hypothetical protein
MRLIGILYVGAIYPVVGISIIYSMHKSLRLKGIVQPQKSGVEGGIIRTVLTSHTIADVFKEHIK